MIDTCPCCGCEIKRCASCGLLKPLESFKAQRDNHCNICHKEQKQRQKKRQAAYYIENKDKKLAYSRKYHLENRQKKSAYGKKWRKENPEKVKGYYRAHQERQKSVQIMREATVVPKD